MRGKRRPRLVGGDVLDEHDEPATLAQVRRGGLRQEEAPLGGDPERSVPVLLGDLLDGLGREPVAGSVDDEVEAAQLGNGTLNERSSLVGS